MTIDYRTGEITEPLTAMERSALTHAEARIERGLTSFVEVGEALVEVRNSRLYREDFGTFEAYCQERWGLSRSVAYDTIAASQTVSAMSAIADVAPENIGQARALAGLGAADAADVMQRAREATGGKVTAAAIREARDPKVAAGTQAEGDGRVESQFKSGAPSATRPQGEEPGPHGRPAPERGIAARPAVTGLDGKTYPPKPPKPAPAPVDEYTDQDRAEDCARELARTVSGLLALTVPERCAEYIATWRLGTSDVKPLGANHLTPERMRTYAAALNAFADQWEKANV